MTVTVDPIGGHLFGTVSMFPRRAQVPDVQGPRRNTNGRELGPLGGMQVEGRGRVTPPQARIAQHQQGSELLTRPARVGFLSNLTAVAAGPTNWFQVLRQSSTRHTRDTPLKTTSSKLPDNSFQQNAAAKIR